MALVVSVIDNNNSGIQYIQYGTDKQKSKVRKFVDKSDAEINRAVIKNYNKKHLKEDKQFAKNVATAINSVPLLAVASGLVLKKGIKPSVMEGVTWGLALLAPKVVSSVNKAAVDASSKIKNAEKKNPMLSYFAGLTASVATFFGLDAVARKAINSPKLGAHPKVKAFASNITTGVQETYKNVTKNMKMPKFAKNLAEKIKMPEFAKKGFETVANSNVTKGIVNVGKSVGKFAVKNAPTLAVVGVFAALIGKTMQQSSEFSKTKANMKESQLDSARVLIDAYARENQSLKNAYNVATTPIPESEESPEFHLD